MDYVEAEKSFFANYIDGDVKEYVHKMRQQGEWGDNVEIQAMSEMYSRRVEIFAYSSEPMKTYQRHLGGANPIRISYHCRCHYNSIDFPELKRQWLTSEPGVWEDRVIAASRSRVRIRPNTATQDEELKLALAVSRQDFKGGDNLFDQEIQKAIELSKKSAADPMQQAVINSLGGLSVDGAASTNLTPEQAAIQRAMLASMQPEVKNDPLQQALAASLQDSELQKVLELSRLEHQGTSSGTASEGSDRKQKKKEEAKKEEARNEEANQNTGPSPVTSANASGAAEKKETTAEASSSSVPAWLEQLMVDMALPRKKCLKAYDRFKGDCVSEEILKTNIIMYCLS
uniref:ubiquitinyl hydrolase 1 n=1 Tax=Lotharella oceanica TaxID=641309 RepID=A0A7S2TPG6_9EUKA